MWGGGGSAANVDLCRTLHWDSRRDRHTQAGTGLPRPPPPRGRPPRPPRGGARGAWGGGGGGAGEAGGGAEGLPVICYLGFTLLGERLRDPRPGAGGGAPPPPPPGLPTPHVPRGFAVCTSTWISRDASNVIWCRMACQPACSASAAFVAVVRLHT